MDWSLVFVNYNSGEHLKTALESFKSDSSAAPPTEIVVVDNASSDGSLLGIPSDVHVVKNTRNLGYARAVNQGTAVTRGKVIAVCNPDLAWRHGVGVILKHFESEADIAAVGPLIRDPAGMRYPSPRLFPSEIDAAGHAALGRVAPNNRFSRRYKQADLDLTSPQDVDWVSGSCIWLRRDALDEVGGWDEQYFMYCEDIDLCWRLEQAGWRVLFEPQAEVMHTQGVSSDQHPYRSVLDHHRSAYLFAKRRSRPFVRPAIAGFLGARAGCSFVGVAWKNRGRMP